MQGKSKSSLTADLLIKEQSIDDRLVANKILMIASTLVELFSVDILQKLPNHHETAPQLILKCKVLFTPKTALSSLRMKIVIFNFLSIVIYFPKKKKKSEKRDRYYGLK